MNALWRHLKPAPYVHGPQALRILGKLAGRNRDFLHIPPKLKAEEHLESTFISELEFESGVKVSINLDKTIEQSRQKLAK